MNDPTAAETVWQGRFITVHKDGKWEYVTRARGMRAAVILAIDDAADGRHAVLVEQHRVPLGRRCIELPAGLVGDHDAGEEVMVAAARELEEETGFRAGRWDHLGDYCSSPGMLGESFALLRATELTKVGNGGGVDGEDILVHRVALGDVPSFIGSARARGLAVDTKVALLMATAWLA